MPVNETRSHASGDRGLCRTPDSRPRRVPCIHPERKHLGSPGRVRPNVRGPTRCPSCRGERVPRNRPSGVSKSVVRHIPDAWRTIVATGRHHNGRSPTRATQVVRVSRALDARPNCRRKATRPRAIPPIGARLTMGRQLHSFPLEAVAALCFFQCAVSRAAIRAITR